MIKLSESIKNKFNKNEFFYSFEIFPPKTEKQLETLYKELDQFLREFKNVLFCNITYHAHSQKSIEHPCFIIFNRRYPFLFYKFFYTENFIQ